MWHVDWHIIKDSRLKGLNLIVFLDDASRCVAGFGIFENATSKNATMALRQAMQDFGVSWRYSAPPNVTLDNGSAPSNARLWTMALRQAMQDFGVPSQMLSDNGRCSAAVKIGGPKKKWKPTIFEQELLENNIALIATRPYHPQTNGKLKRFFRTFEKEFVHFECVGEFMKFTTSAELTFRLTCRTVRLRSWHSATKKYPKRSGKMTQNRWRRIQMTSGTNSHIIHG